MVDVRRADLHTHSDHSDGHLSPTAVVARAYACGLRAVAITDHDCITGLPEGMRAGKRFGVEVLAGVELSASVGPEPIHLLGYFFDAGNRALLEHLDWFRAVRHERVRRISERLARMGVPVELDMNTSRVFARPHVAKAMVRAGHVATEKEAFDRYLADGRPACVSKPPFPAAAALDLLHQAGGIGVLAHPGHFTAPETINALVRAGLDGLETVHPAHDDALTAYYRQLTRDLGLVETGGSDFHKPAYEDSMGRVSVPYGWVRTARRLAATR